MQNPAMIIFTGLPGTGKTTLSRELAKTLSIPLVAKDAIKEIMYDHIGWSDRAFSAKLAHATFGIMDYVTEEQLKTGNIIMLESNYSPKLASEKFRRWQKAYNCTIAQIVCRTDVDVLARRYFARAQGSDRHPGHIDNDRTTEEYKVDLLCRIENGEDQPLDVKGPVKIVDSTAFSMVNTSEIAEWIQENITQLSR